jgi:hypothetical protein
MRCRFFQFSAAINRFAHVVEDLVALTTGQQMFAEAAPRRPRQPAIKIIADKFFELRAFHLSLSVSNWRHRIGEGIVVRQCLDFKLDSAGPQGRLFNPAPSFDTAR